jgi:hypothetical protein
MHRDQVFSKRGLFFILAVLFLATPAWGQQVWFVKQGGADTNSGSGWGEAFATIQKAIDMAAAGDEIRVQSTTLQAMSLSAAYIITVSEKKEGSIKPFAKVKAEVQKALQQERLQGLKDRLSKEMKISVHEVK